MSAPDVARPRAFWADLRFLLGIALIVVSVLGVWLVVAGARQTTPVLAAARTIVGGETLDADDLRVVDVALGQMGETYAAPGTLEPGAVATRTIAEGELVPLSAVGDVAAARTTTVVVHTTTRVPATVRTGATVELWAAPQLERGVYDEPRVLVPVATVAAVSTDDAVVGTATASLELIIDHGDVAAALGAIAAGDVLSVVPTIGR